MLTRIASKSIFHKVAQLPTRARACTLVLSVITACALGGHLYGQQQQPQPEPLTAIISGMVVDNQNSPVAGASVTLSTADTVLLRSNTQNDGRFSFSVQRPERYRITVEAARFRKESATVNIERLEDPLSPLTIKLTPSSLHVAVLDNSGQPLRGVTVSLYTKERGAAGPIAERRTTDENGEIYFGKLQPGSYQLTATLRGYDEYRSDVFITPDIRTELPLQLSAAAILPVNEKAFARYGPPNLPSKNVQSVFQDSNGWMWFGTDKGITRFNGSDFKSPKGLGSNVVLDEDARSIIEDATGTIWVATPHGVRRIAKDGADLGLVLNGQEARQLFVDSRGGVWVATAQGAFRHDGKDFDSFDESKGLPSKDARAIAEDKSGRMWIATAGGVAILESDIFTRLEQPAAESAPVNRGRAARAIDNQPSLADAVSLFVDRSGVVWVATTRGVLYYDGNRVSTFAIDGLRNPNKATEFVSVRAINQDRAGRMLFALDSGGALLYDAGRGESQRLAGIERDRVSAIFLCREGHLWFGTDNGAAFADFYSFVNFTTSRGLPDNDVRAVVEVPQPIAGSDSQRLWFFTSAGVARLDESERFASVDQFRAIAARAAAFAGDGTVWFATDQGVLQLSGQNLTQFNASRLASNDIHWVAAISNGSAMVFATTKGATVYRDGELINLTALAGYDVRHVFEDLDGRLWFSTERGVKSYDLATGESQTIDTAQGLADNDTRRIVRFNDRLLVATRAGIQVYNRLQNGSAFSVFDSEPTNAMFIDRDGFLWTGTDAGQVKKFAVVSGHIVSAVYSGEAHGLTGSRINSFYEDSQRRIWIATDKGVVRHSPVTVAPSAQVSLVVDGKASAVSGDGFHEVPYGRHRLTFRFVAASTSGPVRYLYRLKSKDGEQPWEVLPAAQLIERDVSLLDLEEGAHTFELITLNRDLYGAGAPAATISLRVDSPLWKRWWFYTITVGAIGLALAAIYVAHRLRRREFVLPKDLRSYMPIEPNPYIVGNPIRAEKMFFGREDDFRYVRTKLESASQGVVIVFCGDRRAGKSSILYQVLNGRLGHRFIPVFVDLQEMVIASDAEFFARVARLMAESVARADAQIVSLEQAASATSAAGATELSASSSAQPTFASTAAQISAPDFNVRNPYPVFLDFLDDVLDKIGDRTLLILMDEYELMEGKVDEGKLSTEFFTFLAGLMDNKERLGLIFTGSRRLEERDKKYWRELLRRSLFRKVGFLSEKDTARLVTEPVAGRVVYGRGVIDVIYRLTAGQPFYAQVICQNTVDYLNEHEQNWVTVSDLKRVIEDIVDNPLPQMIYTWDVLSDDEKLVLSLLAGTLADGTAFATAYEIRASVKANEYPVYLSENTIRLTLEEMFRRELLEKDASDGFRFKMDLLRMWIRRSHSIWQVVKEVRTL